MKVFLFGAGASKAAGCPLTSELEKELQKHARVARLKDWKSWQCLREEMKESLNSTGDRHQQMMASPNPEVFLSVIDLYEEVLTKRKQKSRYLEAREAFLHCLRSYFEKKHKESCKAQPPPYLKEKLAELEKGDAVVTLNWDTIVERTLLASNRWVPRDGYGFRKELFLGTSQSDKKPLSPVPKSQIIVLKLHGSVGWYSKNQHVYFDREFLSGFPFPAEDSLRCFDPRQPNEVQSSARAVMAYPTYLKRLAAPEMQQVWRLAGNALRKAHIVEVWGYSLPDSDAAIRILLNELRFRRKVRIYVHEPCEAARKRWCGFLRGSSGQICIDGKKLGCESFWRQTRGCDRGSRTSCDFRTTRPENPR